MTLFERVGGQDWFDGLVDRFYDAVEVDDVLRPLYPADLAAARTHLALFLAQYWGGPPRYQEVRGHPRLRMRHSPFPIGAEERAAWMRHMGAALAAGGLTPGDEAEVRSYFESAATAMMNR